MAELSSGAPISAKTQMLAVAWLRWRIFVNAFRRRSNEPGKITGLIFVIVLRIIFWPALLALFVAPVMGSGLLAWLMVSRGVTRNLPLLLGGIFFVWQYSALQGAAIVATGSNFHPTDLIRFPVPFRRYLAFRLLIGLLTPTTIAGCLALLAAAIGLGVASHQFALPAVVLLASYALMSVLFTRMAGVWIDRWLATRRAREILGALTFLLIIGFQFWNLHGIGHRAAAGAGSAWLLLFRNAAPLIRWLPPGLASDGILSFHADALRSLADLVGLLVYCAVFYAVFAVRLHKEFSGEYLSEDSARNTAVKLPRIHDRPVAQTTPAMVAGTEVHARFSGFAACLRKEWLYLRGNPKQFFSLVTTVFLVFLMTNQHGMLGRHPSYLLPGSIAYVLFGPLLSLFNIFGADGPGVQLYFLAPVRAGDVLLAKNIASIALLVVEVALTWTIVLVRGHDSIPFATQLATGIWVVFILALSLAIGSLRSIQAPRRFVPGQPQGNRPASQTSALLMLGVVFGGLLLQVPVAMLAHRLENPWLPSAVFAPCAVLAVAGYILLLYRANDLMLAHRETFAEEICKG